MIRDKVKLLVFDFGNVMIDLHYGRFFSAFTDIFGEAWNESNIPEPVEEAILAYEKGLISDDAFLWRFQQLNPKADPRKLSLAWNALIGEMAKDTFQMLKSLGKKYKLAILSNINSLHLRHIHRYLVNNHAINNFESDYFDRVFYSHEINMRKPEKEIYSYVESETGMESRHIFFIDDRKENIEQANNAGWHTRLHNPASKIADCIEDYLNEL